MKNHVLIALVTSLTSLSAVASNVCPNLAGVYELPTFLGIKSVLVLEQQECNVLTETYKNNLGDISVDNFYFDNNCTFVDSSNVKNPIPGATYCLKNSYEEDNFVIRIYGNLDDKVFLLEEDKKYLDKSDNLNESIQSFSRGIPDGWPFILTYKRVSN